jgi:hypothetical protein
MTACAGSASAASTALALAIVLICRHLHDYGGDIAAKKIRLHCMSIVFPCPSLSIFTDEPKMFRNKAIYIIHSAY